MANFAETIAERVLNRLPKTWQATTTEINTAVKATIQDALLRMELLTRDEFDAQVNVLKRLREQVKTMQAQIDMLEKEVEKQK